MRGLENSKTPLSGETLPSTGDTALDSSQTQVSNLFRQEVEEDGIRQGALRLLKVRQQSKARQAQTKN
jgi:hypothetical protein